MCGNAFSGIKLKNFVKNYLNAAFLKRKFANFFVYKCCNGK